MATCGIEVDEDTLRGIIVQEHDSLLGRDLQEHMIRILFLR